MIKIVINTADLTDTNKDYINSICYYRGSTELIGLRLDYPYYFFEMSYNKILYLTCDNNISHLSGHKLITYEELYYLTNNTDIYECW
jgi:hypothetical protein